MVPSTAVSRCSDTETKSTTGNIGGDNLLVQSAITNNNSNPTGHGRNVRPRKMIFLSDNPSRVCKICHRHFSSGRALGGHMRIHGRFSVHQSMEPSCSAAVETFMDRKDLSISEDEGESFMDSLNTQPESISDEELRNDQDITAVVEDNINGVDSKSLLSTHRRSTHSKLRFGNPNMDSTAESVELDRQLAMANSGSSGPGLKGEILLKLKRKLDKDGDNFRSMEFLAGCSAKADNDVDQEGSVGPKPVQARICCVCGRGFSTRKALFGHMRCHPERQWRGILPPADHNDVTMGAVATVRTTNKSSSRKRPSLENYSEVELNSEVENDEIFPVQVECSSLAGNINYGQDRSHAQKNKKELADANMDSGDDINNEKERCIWSCTGKRSRRKPASAKFSSAVSTEEEEYDDDDDDEPALTSETTSVELCSENDVKLEEDGKQHAVDKQDYEAVNCLFLLAEAARRVEQERISETRNTEYAPSTDQSNKCNDATKGKGIQLEEAQITPLISANHDDNENVREVIPVREETVEPIAVASCSTAAIVGGVTKYECTTCKRFFSSHQALGGHRASHRKTKGCFAKTSSNANGAEYEIAGIHDISDQQIITEKHPFTDQMKKQNPHVKGHECSVCHRIFPTGQALGGHKRCHWTGDKGIEGSVPSIPAVLTGIYTKLNESVPKAPSKTDEGGILDLNLPAPMDDNEDVGIAFSSVNSIPKSDSMPRIGHRPLLTQNLAANHTTTSTSPWVVKDLLGGHKRRSWNWTQPARQQEDSISSRLAGLPSQAANTSVQMQPF